MNDELFTLLNLCKKAFSKDEIDEVLEFLNVNEKLLALETICAIFYEEKKTVSKLQYEAIIIASKNLRIPHYKLERLIVN